MHSDELSFQEGDTLTLIEEVDEGLWWKASLGGTSGLAPANYIEVLARPVVHNFKDRVQESDEWDSSDEGGSKGTVTCYFNGAPRSVEVDNEVIVRPTFIALYRAIR